MVFAKTSIRSEILPNMIMSSNKIIYVFLSNRQDTHTHRKCYAREKSLHSNCLVWLLFSTQSHTKEKNDKNNRPENIYIYKH